MEIGLFLFQTGRICHNFSNLKFFPKFEQFASMIYYWKSMNGNNSTRTDLHNLSQNSTSTPTTISTYSEAFVGSGTASCETHTSIKAI